MERLTDHENEHYNQPGCNSCSDYRWRSCKESGEIDDCIQRLTWLRLLDIEDILGDDYDLSRLRDLVQADRDGRCTIVSDFVYRFGETKGIIKIPYKPWMERYIGSKFFRTEKEAAGEALRRKQNE